MKIFRLGNQGVQNILADYLNQGAIVVLDNGPTGALICKKAYPLYVFKDRPVDQALSAWGDQKFFWDYFRDQGYYNNPTISKVVTSGIFEGNAFLRYKVFPLAWLVPGVPARAISKGLLQVYSSALNSRFFIGLQKGLLRSIGMKYIYVTSTNKRGLRPARGEQGLKEWAEEFNLPLFLLPFPERAKFDSLPRESFPIVEATSDALLIRRRGWIDMMDVLSKSGAPVREELDTK